MHQKFLWIAALALTGAIGVGAAGRSASAHGDDKSGKKKEDRHCKNAWKLVSDTNVAGDSDDFSGIALSGKVKNLTFAQIQRLSTDYFVETGDCGGGSPRFQISLDTDGDGDHDGNVFVYLGPSPTFTGCPQGVWTSSGNLVLALDGRWDGSQVVPGTQISNHPALSAVVGGAKVLGVSLVVDAGWFVAGNRQEIWVDNAFVNRLELDRGFGGATKIRCGRGHGKHDDDSDSDSDDDSSS